jgi:rhodanese-related sulfurtransferase
MNTISKNELKGLLDGGHPPILIDVVPAEYYQAEHLPGAKNACVYVVSFLDEVAALAPDKEAVIVVYGSSTHSLASTTAREKLEHAGYKNVRNFRGGLEEWAAAGLPLERGPEPKIAQPRFGRQEIDAAKSSLLWTGRNINGAHHGAIAVASGWLDVTEDKSASGEITLDMESISNSDLADPTLNRILIAHLKSDDFFDTKNFPTALFQLRHVTFNPQAKPGCINADIGGALTLKGITDNLAFPALIEVTPNGAFAAEAHFDIDRTRWNVLYGSGKFYEKLGQNLVHDIISLSLRVVTR